VCIFVTVVGISNWNALYVNDDNPIHRTGALQILRRFRRKYNFYSSLITPIQLVRKRVTPSISTVMVRKHKKSSYTQRYTRYHLARVDKTNLVLSIRKIEDRSYLPASIASIHAVGASPLPTGSSSQSECPICHKYCVGEVGVQRHIARVHPEEVDRLRLTGLMPPPRPSHKRKEPTAEDAAAAISALANVAVKVELQQLDPEVVAAVPDGRPSKRARASPSASPPAPLSLMVAAADAAVSPEPESIFDSRRATPTSRRLGGSDADMSDIDPIGSGNSARSRRSGGMAAVPPRHLSDSSAVSEPRIVPFKLKLPPKQPASDGITRTSPSTPTNSASKSSKPLATSSSGKQRNANASPILIDAPSPRTQSQRRIPLQSVSEEEAAHGGINAAPASASAPGKRKRGLDESPTPTLPSASSPSAGKRARGMGASSPSPNSDTQTLITAPSSSSPTPTSTIVDAIDAVKSRQRQQVNKFIP
jgi:hypothetical protein